MWGDFFPFLRNLQLSAQKFLNGILPSVENLRCDAVGCPEFAVERLVVYKTDESVVKGGKIARECEKLLITERPEEALGLLKQELF